MVGREGAAAGVEVEENEEGATVGVGSERRVILMLRWRRRDSTKYLASSPNSSAGEDPSLEDARGARTPARPIATI